MKQEDIYYYPVSVGKFAGLSLLTFGLYSFYWFYKNWQYVRERDQSTIWPFWRMVFQPIWLYPLIANIRRHHGEDEAARVPGGALLTIAYPVLLAFLQLPNPYLLIGFCSFVVFLPIVTAINRINGPSEAYDAHSRFKLRHWLLAIVVAPVLALVLGNAFYLIPSNSVVDEAGVPGWHVDWMVDEGILTEDEEILYYYADGIFSYKSDGNLLTDQSAVSYWQEEDELYFDYAYYHEIESVDVQMGASALDDTLITVTRSDGDGFYLVVPFDASGRQGFVETLQQRVAFAQSGESIIEMQ